MTAEKNSGRYFQDIDSHESNHLNQVNKRLIVNTGDNVGKGTFTLSGQEIPGQCAHENDGFSLADKATDTNGDPSKDSKHAADVENSIVDEPDGIFNNVEVNTAVAERYDAHGHISEESVVMINAENDAIDEHEVVHDKSKAIDTNDDIDVDYDYDDVHESEDINTVDNTNDLNGNPNKDISTVTEENNVHNVCVQEITQNDENNEQETSSADHEVEQNDVSQLNIQDIQNEDVNNDVGMENADEIQGDDEQNNTSFSEGGSVICEEQNTKTDEVLFIEDKLTSLEFDNAGNQTSPADEEFEWNDDNAVVSNDAKHMKKITNKMTKNDVVEDEDDDDGSHFSHISSTMLQSEAKSPHISQLSSFNSYIQCSAGVVDETKTNKKQKNAKQSNQMKNTDITIQMFTPCIMVFSLLFNVTIPSLIIQTRKN